MTDVDCTKKGGRKLCDAINLQSYPTFKHCDATIKNCAPSDLQFFQGEPSLEEFRGWARSNLGPFCGPKHVDLCDDAEKADMAKYSAMSAEELDAVIQNGKDKIQKADDDLLAFKVEKHKSLFLTVLLSKAMASQVLIQQRISC